MAVDLAEHLGQALAALAVEVAEAAAQLGDGGAELVPLAHDGRDLRFQRLRLDLGAEVHRAHLVALAGQALPAGAGAVFGGGGEVGGRGRQGERAEAFGDRGLGGVAGLCGGLDRRLGADQRLAGGVERAFGDFGLRRGRGRVPLCRRERGSGFHVGRPGLAQALLARRRPARGRFRGVRQPGRLPLRVRRPGAQVGDPAGGIGRAQTAVVALADDGLQARLPRRVCPLQSLERALRLPVARPGSGQGRPCPLRLRAQQREVGRGVALAAGVRQRRLRLLPFGR